MDIESSVALKKPTSWIVKAKVVGLGLVLILLAGAVLIAVDYRQRQTVYLAKTAAVRHYLDSDLCTMLVDCRGYIIDLEGYPSRDDCNVGASRLVEDFKQSADNTLLSRLKVKCFVTDSDARDAGL
jgi:hypothetical protein